METCQEKNFMFCQIDCKNLCHNRNCIEGKLLPMKTTILDGSIDPDRQISLIAVITSIVTTVGYKLSLNENEDEAHICKHDKGETGAQTMWRCCHCWVVAARLRKANDELVRKLNACEHKRFHCEYLSVFTELCAIRWCLSSLVVCCFIAALFRCFQMAFVVASCGCWLDEIGNLQWRLTSWMESKRYTN